MESPIQAHPHQHHSSNNQQHHTTSSNEAHHATMRPRRVIGKFFLSKTLGKGSMGKVKLALNTETNEKAGESTLAHKRTGMADNMYTHM